MDQRFANLVDQLAPKLERLIGMRPLKYGALPQGMPKAGVYLFTEKGAHKYVGRSNRPPWAIRPSLSGGRNLEAGGVCLPTRAT